MARCTVEHLMRQHGIEGVRKGKTQRTTTHGPSPSSAADLVRRNFRADRPDQLWLAAFTYIRTWEGWSYLSVVLDVHTRRLIGWYNAPRPHRAFKGRTPLEVLVEYNQRQMNVQTTVAST